MQSLFYALIGILLREIYQRLSRYIAPRYRLRKLRRVLPIKDINQQNEVLIRPSLEITAMGKNGASKRGYTHANETIALQQISNVLADLPIKIHFDYNVVASEVYKAWILLGLSRKTVLPSDIYEKLENETGIRVVKTSSGIKFDHQYFRDSNGNEFHCEHVEDMEFESRVLKDYGLIYRTELENGACILLCGGIHMFGTQAAVEVMLSEDFQKRTAKAKKFTFAQIVEVMVRDDGINIDRNTIKWKELSFVAPKIKK